MKWLMVLLIVLSSCSQKEQEEEPDYDQMVMLEEEEDTWILEQDQVIAGDLPDPQEQIILEPFERP